MLNIEAYALAKKYTDKSLIGAGAIKGAPCQVESIETISGGHRVTLTWELNDGTSLEGTFDVMDGISPEISADAGNDLEQHQDGWYIAAIQSVIAGSTDGAINVDGTEIAIYTVATDSEIDALFE